MFLVSGGNVYPTERILFGILKSYYFLNHWCVHPIPFPECYFLKENPVLSLGRRVFPSGGQSGSMF